MQIKTLFDPSKDIYRTIEKVITYNASQEARLKAEITEYIVTESIEEQFEQLLTKMQMAMESGAGIEIGVWVSGFYGSGKSSFTKYLGLAMDQSIEIEGKRFLEYLRDRMTKPQTRALLSTVANRFPAAVILLDLASSMLAGATMEEVSTVLYYKVLQWAGYSQNLKVAAFERKVRNDQRYQEFVDLVKSEYDFEWKAVQNDGLVIDTIMPEIAHKMYPQLFITETSFTTATSEIIRFEHDRVKEMIDIAREFSGREYIIFIIDEVGQYVGPLAHLILNIDGLAKNIKDIGQGKVWIVGTAQQTLTEDDPKAALNSPQLNKLSARFPIQIDLEPKDIKEICYRRLLAKSPAGGKTLGILFDQHGQELRFNTRLEDAKLYDADFDKETFINLYPFLPSHFDVLLHLLGALAKSTGGIGLRSAIKVVQDILIHGPDAQPPVADQEIGWLATAVTLYDALEKDIRRAEPSIYNAVEKVLKHFRDSSIHQEVAKAVAILQILDNMKVTVKNVASLTHPGVDASSRFDQVKKAVEELIADGKVPFGEKDGNLCFFSEKVNNVDLERAQMPLRAIETRRIHNEILKEVFTPLPSARVHETLTVTAGLKIASGNMLINLDGEKNTIQLVVEFVSPVEYDAARARCIDESRQRSSKHFIYLPAKTSPEIENLVAEIYRCQEIDKKYHNDPDPEVKEYCLAQNERAGILNGQLKWLLEKQLTQGSFIFRGQPTAVETLDADLNKAAKKLLASVSDQVFDRYNEAPIRVETNLAERFLRAGNLKAITSEIDPLGLVQLVGAGPGINTNHRALISIRDFLNQNGKVEGKALSDYFSEAPFGWSVDTLRYLIAAMLVNGELTLRVSGKDITVNGQQAIEGLKNNIAFKNIGVTLRAERLDIELLARAASRLTELTGENVLPVELDISKAAVKYFPQLQRHYSTLLSELKSLGLPGQKRLEDLNADLAEILETDASNVPQRLSVEVSILFESLKWAREVKTALQQGLDNTISSLREHWKEINQLPDVGILGALKENTEDTLEQVELRLGQDNFYKYTADLNNALTVIKNQVGTATRDMAAAQKAAINADCMELGRLPEWMELNHEEQTASLAQLEELFLEVSADLKGLRQLLGHEYTIQNVFNSVKERVIDLGRKRQAERLREAAGKREGRSSASRNLEIPARMTSSAQLDELIQTLEKLKADLATYDHVEISLKLKD